MPVSQVHVCLSSTFISCILNTTISCYTLLCAVVQFVVQALILVYCLHTVALQTLGGQYPVFSAAPAAKLMEEGKVHTVEHLINPLAMQHPEHTNATAATVLPAVSTPPPFQVCTMTMFNVSQMCEGFLLIKKFLV